MKYIELVLLSFTLLLSCHQQQAGLLQPEFDAISKRWVPDQRVGICNFSLENGAQERLILRGESLFPDAKKEILQMINKQGVKFVDSAVILPDTAKIQMNWGLVTLSTANIRGKPVHSSELISQAIMGTPVRILKDTDGWILIQTPDRYIGWTNKSAVKQLDRTSFSEWQKANRMIFTAGSGIIYSDDKKTQVMSDLVAGAIVTMLDGNKEYSQIELPDGRTGYISNQNWINFKQWEDTISLKNNRMISDAKLFLGFPYLWGGMSSKAMDCSGFVKTVCFLNGLILERDASQQVNHGKVVEVTSALDNLEKGDLLFFGSKQPFHVTHVGIYLGNKEVIHASGSLGRVVISSLDKDRLNFFSYLNTNLLGVRRIIGSSPEQGCIPVRLHSWY